MTLQPMTQTSTDAPLIDVDAAFAHRDAKAAVFRPRYHSGPRPTNLKGALQ